MVTLTVTDRFSELVGRALQELAARTDITQDTPGAKARALLEIVMRETNNAYMTFDKELVQAFVKYATGRNLDLIGDLMGISRFTATRAELLDTAGVQRFYVENGTFGDIDSSGSGFFTIPAGTQIQTSVPVGQEPVTYTIIDDVVCQHTASEAFASIRSIDFGVAANVGKGTLIVHNFEQYTDYLNKTLKTTNIDGIIHAASEETDDDFRYRMINQTLGAETANAIAVRLAAITVPGVADVVMDEYSMGIGSGSVYIKATIPVPSDLLLVTVESAISRVKAWGSLVDVRAPKTVGLELKVTLNLYNAIPNDEQENLKARVRDAVKTFVNSLDIDQTMHLSDVVREILAVDTVIKGTGTYEKPLDEVYIYKYSASEDNRVRRKLLADSYIAGGFERVIIEEIETPIRVAIAVS
jgi:uncharacterized phage protein gp47/JayE